MPPSKKTASSKGGSPFQNVLTCIPKRLRPELQVAAAERACEINPQNNPALRRMAHFIKGFKPTREHIALVTSKYWGPEGVDLSVSFMETRPVALRRRILEHMNAWAAQRAGLAGANVRFRETQGTGEVRIAFEGGVDGGYWSYVGTDILGIPLDQQTLNLERFSMQTPEREFVRVVRHEAGHTLGFPHEHMRRELVARIDRKKAIEYFGRTQGWTPDDVDAQVLTPLEESSIMGTERADDRSIMCYDIPPEITVDGEPIVGGDDIDEDDYAFALRIYPPERAPQAPVPPGPEAEIDSSSGGCGAATVEIKSGCTQITVRVGRPAGGGASALPPPVGASVRTLLAAARVPAPAANAREAVDDCLRDNSGPGATWNDATLLGNIPVVPDDVSACLNFGYLKNSPDKFAPGEAKTGWTVLRLIGTAQHKH